MNRIDFLRLQITTMSKRKQLLDDLDNYLGAVFVL